ncbi:MAG: TIGR03663 family protein [Chloroflexaceae bacterium]|nr:TIGR03663 family protein [Chloroflexaceae bacterium]
MTTTETTPKLLPAIEQPGLIAVPVAEPAVRGAFPTFEQVVYLALAVLAAIAHFWMLDVRALHHDETLHATYSWYIYIGNGYMHDPLLHGPFLYYLGSFLYFLFGDTDFSARLGAALFGTILTVLPFFIRREIGRTAALAASVYLLLSPTFLYVGRFFRHDIYSIVFELLVVIAIVRYASTRRALWLYVGIAAFALMYVNQETSYLFLLMMATPLVLLLLWRVFKPGILLVGALGVALALLVFVLPGEAVVDGSHTAERDPQTDEMVILAPGPIFGWGPIETEDNNYALRIRNRADNTAGNLFASMAGYIGDLWLFFRHPAILTGIGLLLGTIALSSADLAAAR